MIKQQRNNIKLGIFVLLAFCLLVLSFYLIGSEASLFGKRYELRARFSRVNGLMVGNNVLYAGIQAGTVERIQIVDDSTIEVSFKLDTKLTPFIHRNASASIGTDGVLGNKVININPTAPGSAAVKPGDLLNSEKITNTNEMIKTFSKTNNNASVISGSLKNIVSKIDTGKLLSLLNNEATALKLEHILENISLSTGNIDGMTGNLSSIIQQTKKGNGAAGILLADTQFEGNLKASMLNFRNASINVNKAAGQLNDLAVSINTDLNNGQGTLHMLLKDTTLAKNLAKTMDNVQRGTDGFNQNMEALKHNFLFRGYFKHQEGKNSINKR